MSDKNFKERPILFSAAMVRAILDGRKTQTRRIVKPQPLHPVGPNHDGLWSDTKDPVTRYFACKHGQTGDRLRVKEAAWMWCERKPNGKTKKGNQKWLYVPMKSAEVRYCADHPEKPEIAVVSPRTGNVWGWRKKIGRFLPKWAVRIRLEVVKVRVERLQEISESDAVAEGIEKCSPSNEDNVWRDYSFEFDTFEGFKSPVESYRSLWEVINGDDAWAANPWVWVVEFKRVETDLRRDAAATGATGEREVV